MKAVTFLMRLLLILSTAFTKIYFYSFYSFCRWLGKRKRKRKGPGSPCSETEAGRHPDGAVPVLLANPAVVVERKRRKLSLLTLPDLSGCLFPDCRMFSTDPSQFRAGLITPGPDERCVLVQGDGDQARQAAQRGPEDRK